MSQLGQPVDDRNHQPVVSIICLINLGAKLITTANQMLQGAAAYFEHFDRTIRHGDEQVSSTSEKPYSELIGQKPMPFLQQLAPIEAGMIDQVVVNVHQFSSQWVPAMRFWPSCWRAEHTRRAARAASPRWRGRGRRWWRWRAGWSVSGRGPWGSSRRSWRGWS
jgi:hypothetical protein